MHQNIIYIFSIKPTLFFIFFISHTFKKLILSKKEEKKKLKNISHQIINFTLHFIKILIFLDFFNCFSFFIHNHHPLSSFILEIHKERIKTKCKWIVPDCQCKFIRCSNLIFLHNFLWPDVNEFLVWLAKMWYFSYYTSTRSDTSSQSQSQYKCPSTSNFPNINTHTYRTYKNKH